MRSRNMADRHARPRVLLFVAVGVIWAISASPGLAQGNVLQCVPFARALSGIALHGDAWRWWSAAASRYDRGTAPRAGSILSFRSGPRMPLGHVAVVTKVLGRREIEIDHANWSWPGAISHEVEVVDVSERNDWSAVRVELSQGDGFGGVYQTDGFIYGRPIDLAALAAPQGAAAPSRAPVPERIDVAAWLAARGQRPS